MTLRQIAERVFLPDIVELEEVGDLDVPPRMDVPDPRHGCAYHVFCSDHNAGAAQVVSEVAEAYCNKLQPLTNAGGSAQDGIAMCEQMLLYLDARTWASGETSAKLVAEVRQAMALGVPLLLVHEVPGLGQSGRHPTPFPSFFKSTPDELIDAGLYHKIAIALMGGDGHRAVSLGKVAHAMMSASGKHEHKVVAPEPTKGAADLDAARKGTSPERPAVIPSVATNTDNAEEVSRLQRQVQELEAKLAAAEERTRPRSHRSTPLGGTSAKAPTQSGKLKRSQTSARISSAAAMFEKPGGGSR